MNREAVANELVRIAEMLVSVTGGTRLAAYDKVEGWSMADDSQSDSLHIEFYLSWSGQTIIADAEWSFWADHKMSGHQENDGWKKRDTATWESGVNEKKNLIIAMEDLASKFSSMAKKAYSPNNWTMPNKRNRLNDRGYQLQSILRKTLATTAMEFPTKDALNKYLKDHPDADKGNHKVVEEKKSPLRKVWDKVKGFPQHILDEIDSGPSSPRYPSMNNPYRGIRR